MYGREIRGLDSAYFLVIKIVVDLSHTLQILLLDYQYDKNGYQAIPNLVWFFLLKTNICEYS